MKSIKSIASLAVAIAVAAVGSQALAGHNLADVDITTADCGETTFTATIDPNGGHLVSNTRLVVSVDGDTQNEVIPVDGTDATITVGPFHTSEVETKTISWRVFGGGERSYDQPLWNGFGDASFSADINAYGADNGFGWVVAGPDDPNPFTTWNEVEVDSCAITKDMCKQGGFADFGFKNQGQCIRYANTGKDSR